MANLSDDQPANSSSQTNDGATAEQDQAFYKVLFNAIDEGFCIIEVLFDDQDKPYDYRFLEANPAFIQQTGLTEAIGRTVREVAPPMSSIGSIFMVALPARWYPNALKTKPRPSVFIMRSMPFARQFRG